MVNLRRCLLLWILGISVAIADVEAGFVEAINADNIATIDALAQRVNAGCGRSLCQRCKRYSPNKNLHPLLTGGGFVQTIRRSRFPALCHHFAVLLLPDPSPHHTKDHDAALPTRH